jgi:hypothetical protein
MERFKRYALPAEDALSVASHSRLRAAKPSAVSSEHSLRYESMREVLLGYLSPILVDSVLERALAARQVQPSMLTEAQLSELASDIMVGLRLFVEEQRLPELMLALADVLGGHS